MDEQRINDYFQFSDELGKACETIQEGAGCDNCPIRQRGHCVGTLELPDASVIPKSAMVEFFNFAQDVDDWGNENEW